MPDATPLKEFTGSLALLLELYDRELIDPENKADGREKFLSALHGICKAVASYDEGVC